MTRSSIVLTVFVLTSIGVLSQMMITPARAQSDTGTVAELRRVAQSEQSFTHADLSELADVLSREVDWRKAEIELGKNVTINRALLSQLKSLQKSFRSIDISFWSGPSNEERAQIKKMMERSRWIADEIDSMTFYYRLNQMSEELSGKEFQDLVSACQNASEWRVILYGLCKIPSRYSSPRVKNLLSSVHTEIEVLKKLAHQLKQSQFLEPVSELEEILNEYESPVEVDAVAYSNMEALLRAVRNADSYQQLARSGTEILLGKSERLSARAKKAAIMIERVMNSK